MRHTLEQLKAMSGIELKGLWSSRIFPFDMASECRCCLTMHQLGVFCEKHVDFTRAAQTIKRIDNCAHTPEALEQNLEELYALRLFYDHLYPQPTQEQVEQDHKEVLASAIQREKEAVEESFARMEENELEMRAGLQYGDE